MKKILGIVLAATLILGLFLPATTFAAKPDRDSRNTHDGWDTQDFQILKKLPSGNFGGTINYFLNNLKSTWHLPTTSAGFTGAPVRVDRYAVIIGISDYPANPETGINGSVLEGGLDLYYADDDAYTVAGVLTGVYGFDPNNITMLVDSNGTKSAILNTLADLRQKVNRNDEVVLYFSGHSAVYNNTTFTNPFRLGNRAGFVVWADDQNQDAPDIVWDRQINTALNLLKTNRIVIGLDCCYASNFAELSGLGRIFMGATDQDGISGEFGPDYTDIFGVDPNMIADGFGLPPEAVPPGGLFTTFFVTLGLGLGFGDYPPTGNMDGTVTVEEAFYFAQGVLTEMSAQFADFGLDEVPVIIDLFRGDMEL